MVKKSKKEKAITVVQVDNSVIYVPHDKVKLKSNGQMKLCLVSPSYSKQIISDKLNQLFEKPVKVHVTKSGDLFDCCDNEDIDGKLLLDIVGNGLFVRKALCSICYCEAPISCKYD